MTGRGGALRTILLTLLGAALALLLPMCVHTGDPGPALAVSQQAVSEQAAVVADAPRSFEATQAAGRAAAPELVAQMESLPLQADPVYLPILAGLAELATGSADPRGEELLAEALRVQAEQPLMQAQSALLRDLYDNVYGALLIEWQARLSAEGLDLESRARLACMHRTALRELTRDLMRDTNAVAVLRERDRVKYGQGTGPTCDQLYQRELAKEGATPDRAWANVIGGSQRHNTSVSDALRAPPTQPSQPQPRRAPSRARAGRACEQRRPARSSARSSRHVPDSLAAARRRAAARPRLQA